MALVDESDFLDKEVDVTPEKYIEIFGIKDVQIDKAEDKP